MRPFSRHLAKYCLLVITLIITTSLKYPAAVGYARMLQPPQIDATPWVTPPGPGSWGLEGGVDG